MKTSLLENRPLACIVLVIAVLISVFGIGGAKLSSVGKKADNYFIDNIQGDITARETNAQNLLDITKDGFGDTAAYASVQKALDEMGKAKEADELYAANQKLTSSFELLYGTYCEKTGNKYPGGAIQEQLSDFRSHNDMISNATKEYNELARAATKDMSGFPASLIAAITGAKVTEFA